MNIDISIMLPYVDESLQLCSSSNKCQEQIPFFKTLNDRKNKTFINRSASVSNINYFNNNSNSNSNSNSHSNLISQSCLQFSKGGINESYLSTTSDYAETTFSSGEIFKSYTSLINMTYYRSDLIVQTVSQFDIVPYIGVIASPTTQITFTQNDNNHSLFFVVNFS